MSKLFAKVILVLAAFLWVVPANTQDILSNEIDIDKACGVELYLLYDTSESVSSPHYMHLRDEILNVLESKQIRDLAESNFRNNALVYFLTFSSSVINHGKIQIDKDGFDNYPPGMESNEKNSTRLAEALLEVIKNEKACLVKNVIVFTDTYGPQKSEIERALRFRETTDSVMWVRVPASRGGTHLSPFFKEFYENFDNGPKAHVLVDPEPDDLLFLIKRAIAFESM